MVDLEPSPEAGEGLLGTCNRMRSVRGTRGQEPGTGSAGPPLISATPEWTAPSTLCSALKQFPPLALEG